MDHLPQDTLYISVLKGIEGPNAFWEGVTWMMQMLEQMSQCANLQN